MKLDIREKFKYLLREKNKVVIKKNEEGAPIKIESAESSSLKVERFMYYRLENVKIDWDFKYKHYALTGDAQTDFANLFGEHDSHGSARVLEHSFLENYLKIKRSYDICLARENGVYNIYNGRHRIVYLKAFLEKYGPMTANGYYEVPASVSYYIDDIEVNTIINSLKGDYNAVVNKGNYYDDQLSFLIVIESKLYVLKSKEELKDFYESVQDDCSNFLLGTVSDKMEASAEKIFQSIFSSIGKTLFEMSFVELFYYIKENGVILDNSKLGLEDLDFSAIYTYHLRICESVQTCKIYNYEIPNGLEVTKVRSNPMNFYGCIIMDFIYDNPAYQNLKWDELFEIVKKFREFENCDSDFLREAAKRWGYVEGKGQVQVQKRKRITIR